MKGTDDQLDSRSNKKQLKNDAIVLAWVTWRLRTKDLFRDERFLVVCATFREQLGRSLGREDGVRDLDLRIISNYSW